MSRRAGWRDFAPVGLSVLAGTALLSFVVMYGSPFNDYLPSTAFTEGTFGPDTRFRLAQKGGLLTFYVTTLIYLTPLLALLKRWRPPFGTATLAIGLPALGIMAVDPLLLGAPILAASGIAAGLIADVLIAELDPSPERRNAYLAFGALTPVPLVALSLAAIEIEWGLGWGVTLVTGSMVISALVGTGLALALSAPEKREVTA